MSFVHLQVKSAYSLLLSAASVERLVERSKQLKYEAIALTDHHVLYGAIAFYKLCLKHQIKPIFGLTASVEIKGESYPFILLAKNEIGYRHLLKISSLLQTKYKKGIPISVLKTNLSELIVLSGGKESLIEKLILEGKEEDAKKAAQFFQQVTDGAFYLSIQRLKETNESELNHTLINISRSMSIPLVATNDVSYVEKDDAFAYECMVAIGKGTQVTQETVGSDERYLKAQHEMIELFRDIPEAVENTKKIADQCQVKFNLGQLKLPKYPVPNGMDSEQYFERLCIEGLKKRVNNPSDVYYDRLIYEIEIIKRMNFCDYFLIVSDFMLYAREQGILTGPGRGSAAGSLVAYALHITDVDPIKYHLLFERFLNPERITMPDIDIDFPDSRRDEMIQYVMKKYGKHHVAQIITFGTLAAKAAVRDIGRVLGASLKEVDSIAKQIPSKPGITLREAIKESPALKAKMEESTVAKHIIETAMKVEGLPRHASTHAAGVVLSDQPLVDIIPLQEGHQGVFLTQYAMDHLEDVGLLKMDFLGLRNLTLIENVTSLIEKYEGTKISFEEIQYKDHKTFSLLAKGDTTGVFQLESEGMRNVLRRLAPHSLEDIVAVNALYRPGPMENIPLFIDRKHGKKAIEYPHDDLQEILSRTYGVIVYQEQIMEIASKMAGFSLGEADLLRRAVGKKIKSVLEEEREHFVEGCKKKGYSIETANQVYDLIVKFANYGFNRSHAVAYSMISFQLAYLKAHYPHYFMAALLSSVSSSDSKLAQYIQEGKSSGMEFLPPSINRSGYSFFVEKGAIRFSLAAIKNVGISALKEIFQERKKRPFEDLFDFCVRVSGKSVNRRTIESLIFSGAFDEFGVDRAVLLASLDVALNHAELLKGDDENQFDLFLQEELNIKPKYVEVEPLPPFEKLQYEKEALGFYFSSHPVDPYEEALKQTGAIQISEAQKRINRQVSMGVFLANCKPIRTKKGEAMAFLSVSDSSGELEAVIFPKDYAKYNTLLQTGSVLVVQGKMEVRNEKLQLIVQSVSEIKTLVQSISSKKVFIKLQDASMNDQIDKLKNVLRTYQGSSPVYVYYEHTKKTVQLQREYWINPTESCIQLLKNIVGEKHVVVK